MGGWFSWLLMAFVGFLLGYVVANAALGAV
jgi:hypothetical protein